MRYATVKEQKGHMDILFANSGIGEVATLGDITEAHFDKVFGINVKGLLFTVQKALPLFQGGGNGGGGGGGSIILNASVAASKGVGGFSAYNATKAAVRSFARTWTADLKQRRIRVNAISPGPIDTPCFDGLLETDEQKEQFREGLLSAVPMGRMGSPDEIAKAATFLASDDSSFITGIELFVDGHGADLGDLDRGYLAPATDNIH